MTPRLRKILIITAGAIVVIIAILLIFNTATTVDVTIKTNNQQAKVVIGTAGDPDVTQGRGTMTTRLNPGTYTVKVTHDNQETRGLLTVKTDQENTIQLDLVPPKDTFLIASFAGSNLRATNDAIKFIWSNYNQLTQIPQEGGDSVRINLVEYSQAVWIDDTHAFLQDTGGIYYYFDGQQKNLPYGVDPNTLSVAPSGAVAYVQDQTAYVRPNAFAEPSAQFTIEATQPQTVLGPQGHVLVYDLDVGPESSTESHIPEIFKDGKKITAASDAIKNVTITGGAWSPDGTKLALSAGDGLYVLDIATNSLTPLYEQMPDNPESIVWSSNDTLLYLLENTLWQVNVGQTKSWVKLAHIEQSLGIVGPLALSPNKKVFFSTNTSLLEGGIFSVSLE